MQGLLWHLGSRPMLSIFERPWIHGNPNPSFPMLRQPLPPNTVIQISSLIIAGQWDLDRLAMLFHPDSVQAISSIPLPITAQLDHPLWYFTSSGQYTTSSGYAQALRVRPEKKKPPSLAPLTDPFLWRSVWDLLIQPKLVSSSGGYVIEFPLL
ncbi:hypothetical protein LINPERHAP2_LOCUS19844 [Linum perenne]